MNLPNLIKCCKSITLLCLSILIVNNALAQTPDDNWDARFNTLGITGTVLTTASSGTDLYVGGNLTAVGGTSANNIAKWNGVSWSLLGTSGNNGTNGSVNAIAVDGSDIYVGGSFTSAGGVSVSNIAKWDGNNWSALGSGVDGDIQTILVKASDEIYVGGFFSNAGGQSVNNIAKWNGSNWSALGSGVNSTVRALAYNSNLVYVGGSFTSAGGGTANKIAAWNSSNSTWSILGDGMALGDVNALHVLSNELYAGGLFSSAGGVSAKKIAKWDGGNWSALGEGMTGGDVNALTSVGSALYAAGSFTTAGSVNADQVAKWDGNSWSALGSGIDGGLVFTLSSISTAVYAGGSFTTAGGKSSQKIALWDEGGSVPIELATFSATIVDSQIKLRWVTLTEENNYGFDIERKSGSDQQWEKIAFMSGYGTTQVPQYYEYADAEAIQARTAGTIQYRLKQIDIDGAYEYFGPAIVNLNNLPTEFRLEQNYPNPFNPQTKIRFTVPASAFTSLKIYNIKGEEVHTALARHLDAGQYEIVFDASAYPSGAYYYVLKSGSLVENKTMLLLK